MSSCSILYFQIGFEVRKIIDAEKMYQYNSIQILLCHEQISIQGGEEQSNKLEHC